MNSSSAKNDEGVARRTRLSHAADVHLQFCPACATIGDALGHVARMPITRQYVETGITTCSMGTPGCPITQQHETCHVTGPACDWEGECEE